MGMNGLIISHKKPCKELWLRQLHDLAKRNKTLDCHLALSRVEAGSITEIHLNGI